MVAAVFLDRDGVIIENVMRDGKPCAPRKMQDFKFLPNVKLAIHNLKMAGYMIIVVTNQPDIGAGKISKTNFAEMHKKLLRELPVDKIYVCPHTQEANCECRKPKPGMLLEAKKDFNIDLEESWIVGDRRSDIEAGLSVGCTPVLINKDIADIDFVYEGIGAKNLLSASKYITGGL